MTASDDAARPCPLCGGRNCADWKHASVESIGRCRDCGLVFLLNVPDESTLYEGYYEGSSGRAKPPAPAAVDELRQINLQRLDAMGPAAGRLLDIGCGRGYFVRDAVAHGWAAQGMDVSASAIRFACDELGVDARVGLLADLGESAGFDMITLWHVVEHFADPVGELRRVRSALSEGGRCLVEVPNVRSLKFTLSGRKWEGGNHPRYHRSFFNAPTLRRTLVEAGFSRVRRISLSYRLHGRNPVYERAKGLLSGIGMDAFLVCEAYA